MLAGAFIPRALSISKDNVQFGIRAVDRDGNRSAVAAPLAVA
jgi:hypothetical protein